MLLVEISNFALICEMFSKEYHTIIQSGFLCVCVWVLLPAVTEINLDILMCLVSTEAGAHKLTAEEMLLHSVCLSFRQE